MPVLRSREVVFTPLPPKTPRKRKSTPSVDADASTMVAPSTPLTKDGISKRPPDSISPRRPSEKGLGVGRGAGGRRRSLRLANMRSIDSNVVVGKDSDGDEREKKLGRGSESNGIVSEVRTLNSPDMVSDGVGGEGGSDRREEKGKRVQSVGSDALGLDAGMNKRTKFSAVEKGKSKLVFPAEPATDNFGEEKGKEKLLSQNEFISPGLKVNILEEKSESIAEVSNAVSPEKGHRVDAPLTLGRRKREGETQEGAQRRMQDRQRALRAAPKFALFRSQENEQEGDVNRTVSQLPARDPVDEDWPGPFSTARKIIDEREERLAARLSKSDTLQEKIDWIPSKNRVFERKAPTLLNLALRVLVKNSSEIESLRAVPYVIRNQLTLSLSRFRKMDDHILGLLVSDQPSEICVPDCSWLTEEKFQKLFANCNTEQLEVLELNLCGRCLPDYILRFTLARSPNSMPKLSTVSFCGDYRLSDDGLFALVSAAPLLRSVNLSQCSLLTSAGINKLAETLAGVLRELVIDECSSVEGMLILPALKKVKNLEALSVCGVQSVTDAFIDGLLSMCGPNMKILGLASCEELSNASVKSIAEHCLQLHTLNLRNLDNLNDDAIAYLANGCSKIQNLKLQRNNFSDEAFAVFLQKSGRTILELGLNNIELVAHKTALAILSCCKSLQKLDLSFCREMSEEAIGLIVDSCSDLKVLKLFGCTQVTDVFLNGHRNSHVEVIGLKGPIMKNLDVPNLL